VIGSGRSVLSTRRSTIRRLMLCRDAFTTVRCKYIGAALGSLSQRQRRQSRRQAS
jgi:hypothetical protein